MKSSAISRLRLDFHHIKVDLKKSEVVQPQLVTYFFRWQYTMTILTWVPSIPRRRLESVIAKYSKYPHQCGEWQQHIHLKTLDSSSLEPCRSTSQARKTIPQAAAIPRFQTEMSTKRQNLLLLLCSLFNIYIFFCYFFKLKQVYFS